MKLSLIALTSSVALSLCAFAADEPKKDADNTAHYGKVAFAQNVIAKKHSDVDFSRFDGILDRIASVIEHHSKSLAK